MKNVKYFKEMMSNIPTNNVPNSDNEILRSAIIAEYDAINLYEQMAHNAKTPLVKKVLLDIAKEEKTHVGELEAVLIELDKEHAKEMKNGKKEIDEMND